MQHPEVRFDSFVADERASRWMPIFLAILCVLRDNGRIQFRNFVDHTLCAEFTEAFDDAPVDFDARRFYVRLNPALELFGELRPENAAKPAAAEELQLDIAL